MPKEPLKESIYAVVLAAYVLAVIYVTRHLYSIMRSWGLPHNVAVYYNRKIIHVAAGGVVAVLTPALFTSPLIPSIAAFAMAALLYAARRIRLMEWFQTPDNMYEVNFNVAWGVSLLALWILLGDPWLAVLPALFISLGDAITGAVRNMLFARRTKHIAGNIAMALVVVPMGYAAAGDIGAIIGLAASLAERLELGPIDDNIIVALVASAGLLASRWLGLI
ncbi:MAG: dolichol kinase [Desulfurococcales archaeon]|nr:dolichol kinase [Desulfurococcales archaeon]